MTEKGDVLSRTTVKNITKDEVTKEDIKEEIHGYISLLNQTI